MLVMFVITFRDVVPFGNLVHCVKIRQSVPVLPNICFLVALLNVCDRQIVPPKEMSCRRTQHSIRNQPPNPKRMKEIAELVLAVLQKQQLLHHL